MKKIIVVVVALLLVPIVNADVGKELQGIPSYVKEAECINLIANLALVNPVMGEISMAMLARRPACEVVSIVREAQRLSGAGNVSNADVMNRTYSDIVEQTETAMEHRR